MHEIKVLLGTVLCHDVNKYDVITTLWPYISVNKYTKIIKMMFCVLHIQTNISM